MLGLGLRNEQDRNGISEQRKPGLLLHVWQISDIIQNTLDEASLVEGRGRQLLSIRKMAVFYTGIVT